MAKSNRDHATNSRSASPASELLYVDPDLIDPNPENPRLIFRETEMNQLLESIREVGIKVPLSIYRHRRRYVLLDGERRWRCAKKLNLEQIPVVVHPTPSKLENILTMFNIHNVRTDWDLMPMALKLSDVADILRADGKGAGPADLAGVTGVPLATVRRALELLNLPKRYRAMLLREARKPRDQQRIKPDLFLEINKALRAIDGYVPEVFHEVSEAQYRDALVKKYTDGVVVNVVNFRLVGRIARAERAGEDPESVVPVLVRLAKQRKLTVEEAFESTVERAYEVRDIQSRATSLRERLTDMRGTKGLSTDARRELRALREEIERLLGRD